MRIASRIAIPLVLILLAIGAAGFGGAPAGEAAPPEVKADLFVSTSGNDAWSGRLAAENAAATDGPLATISAAQRAVRRIRQAEPDRNRPIVVAIRGGTYRLAEPIAFSADDSGTRQAPVVYQACAGERPIFSGGQEITGWQVDEQGRWNVDLAGVKEGGWSFTQLFVNDQRRFRPRLPQKGYYKIARKLDPSARSGKKGHDRFGFNPGEIRRTGRTPTTEVIAFHEWTACTDRRGRHRKTRSRWPAIRPAPAPGPNSRRIPLPGERHGCSGSRASGTWTGHRAA